ncbi:hypothetical protein [Aeromonas veronii]
MASILSFVLGVVAGVGLLVNQKAVLVVAMAVVVVAMAVVVVVA